MPDVLIVFLAALATAIATGLGALPLVSRRAQQRSWLGFGNAAAAGVMTAASIGLIAEGSRIGPWRVAVGILLGIVLIRLSDRLLKGRGPLDLGALQGADARKALMIVGIMTLHSFAEGIGVGVSFGESEGFGTLISAAIALHNVPEGLAISLVLVPRGVSVLAAAGWSVFSSLPQPLMAVPAFLFVLAFAPVLPVGLGLAAGAMLWMAAAELVPEARRDLTPVPLSLTFALAGALMLGFQVIFMI